MPQGDLKPSWEGDRRVEDHMMPFPLHRGDSMPGVGVGTSFPLGCFLDPTAASGLAQQRAA